MKQLITIELTESVKWPGTTDYVITYHTNKTAGVVQHEGQCRPAVQGMVRTILDKVLDSMSD